ncbi:MAG: hypothetical protein OIN87_07755 [Candidatus Methanoperedens sp.]|nr:hypothetical protein [Candidatus Methanoperedens sp.]
MHTSRKITPLINGCIDPSGFKPSCITVIEGTSALVPDTLFNLCARSAVTGRDVILVDGANSFNPYAISRAVKFMGFEPKSTLSRIHVARAFTEYQMDAIISGMREAVIRWEPQLLAVLYLSNLFSMQDGKKLFSPILKSLKEVTRSLNTITVVTSFGGMWWADQLVAGNADRVIRIEEKKDIVKVRDGDNLFEHVNVPPGQTRFNDYFAGG